MKSDETRKSDETSWFNQRHWRTIGGVSIVIAAAMAWYGSENITRENALWFAAYWFGFAVLFLVALYMVLLDIRFIRLQYLVGQRDLYLDAVADEMTRRLQAAKEEADRSAREEQAARDN